MSDSIPIDGSKLPPVTATGTSVIRLVDIFKAILGEAASDPPPPEPTEE